MITLQKNAISIIFEDIFCYFCITHDALRPRPFAQNIFHLDSPQASLRSMAVLSSRAQERRSSCSRPNLLAVSLPSPAFIA